METPRSPVVLDHNTRPWQRRMVLAQQWGGGLRLTLAVQQMTRIIAAGGFRDRPAWQ